MAGLNIRPLSKELQEKAIKELNEVPERIPQDIEHIKNWLRQQPHLNARMDDQWILNFLRGCKFSLEKTKKKLDIYYTIKSHLPQYFRNRDPFDAEIQELLNTELAFPLIQTDGPAGPRVAFARYGNFNPKFSFEKIVKLGFMIVDICLWEDDNFVVAGQHLIGDGKGASLEYMASISIADCLKFQTLSQDGYPSRPQSFDLINAPPFYEMVYNMFKPVMSELVKTRLHIYTKGDTETIKKIVPVSIMPKEYGGDTYTVSELSAYWKKKVESYSDWFKDDEQYGVDESKRPGKPLTDDDLFGGTQGSFRQLEVD